LGFNFISSKGCNKEQNGKNSECFHFIKELN
jgi:hypothetical protein